MAFGDSPRALSITGPYGSGKSSLAIFLDALVSPSGDPVRDSAEETLRLTDPDTLKLIENSRELLGAKHNGFVRAIVTAQREPVTLTVLRGLKSGVQRFEPSLSRQEAVRRRTLVAIEDGICRFSDRTAPRPTVQLIRELLEQLSVLGPILLAIDEFGKNLEAFADAPADADLFLLQQLAEWSHGDHGLPLVVITLQHLAFDEYVANVSDVQRREWAKVQGRFEDISYVDTAVQTRVLIANAWESNDHPAFENALRQWAETELKNSRRAGLADFFAGAAQVAGCWPLHPVAQLVLPELCARYGQNERTLFSFLAGHEPFSLTSFLAERTWLRGRPLAVARLDRLYDYFVGSASTTIGAAQSASRWIEIESLIRDAVGLSATELRVLKTIGLLNLISAGGTLRASRAVVLYAVVDGLPGTEHAAVVSKLLTDLEKKGLVIFRDFADEYRLWRGSDFDLRTAIDVARRQLRTSGGAGLLAKVKPLPPLVAGRHSQQTHTLRSFKRMWVDHTTEVINPPSSLDASDGLVAYLLEATSEPPRVESSERTPKPVVAVRPPSGNTLLEAATELGALQEVLSSEASLEVDWVARRELTERIAEATQKVDLEFELTFGPMAKASWLRLSPGLEPAEIAMGVSPSAVLSEVADASYPSAPVVRNEMLNRTELTSQGAKARRVLLEAMITRAREEKLGLDGYGPERAMYEAALARPGIHRLIEDSWTLAPPIAKSDFEEVWKAIVEEFERARSNRMGLAEVTRTLLAPPFGLRAGVVPVLLTAALIVHADDLAIYEHGTYRAALTPELSERMVRNPNHFEIKHFAAKEGVRSYVIERFGAHLGLPPARRPQRNGSVLSILNHLVGHYVLPLPTYSRRTSRLSAEAVAVREALLTATEPDILLFRMLPRAVHQAPVPATAPRFRWPTFASWIPQVVTALEELRSAYSNLLDYIEAAIVEATGADADGLRETLSARMRSIETAVLDPKLRAFLTALLAPLEREEWLVYVSATVVGSPPESWTEEDLVRFFRAIHELGITLRRIEALHYDRRARDAVPFDAMRVTFTRPDGAEDARLVWTNDDVRAILEPALADLLARATRATGRSATGGLDTLLALLGAHLFPEPSEEARTRNNEMLKDAKREGQGRG
jgi:hypothetical protein